MKKRTAFIGALVSLIPLGQPLLIKTGVTFSTVGVTLFVSEKVNAESAEFYINRGSDKLDAEDYKGAISDFTEAIKINPDDGDAYFNRGLAKNNLPDYKGAKSDFTEAIKINPDDGDAYFYRGIAKENLEDYKGAISDFTEAIKINPDDGDAYFNRGLAKNNLKDYKGAKSDFTEAIKINPDDGDAYEGRFEVNVRLGDYEGAISDNDKKLKLSEEKIELSFKDIVSQEILKGEEIKFKAFKKFAGLKGGIYTKPLTYYIHDKTSKNVSTLLPEEMGNSFEISDDEEKFIVDLFNYIDSYIDLDFERVDSKSKAVIRIYKTTPESGNEEEIVGTGSMSEEENLRNFYIDLAWVESKILYPKLKNYSTLSIDDAYTIAHEIGHALGLEHQEPDFEITLSSVDPDDLRINSSRTIMSYNRLFDQGKKYLGGYYTELDIQALRKVWGFEKGN